VPLVPSRPVFVVRAQAVAVAAGAGGVSSFPLDAPSDSMAALAPRGGAYPGDAVAEPNLGVADDDFMLPAAEPAYLSPEPEGFAPESADPVAGEPRPQMPGRRAGHAGARKGSAGRRVFQLFVLVALAAGGVAGGQYAMMKGLVGPLQVHPALEPLSPLLLGGLVGVLLAWPVIRWTSPRR